jgi:hypothetical protein
MADTTYEVTAVLQSPAQDTKRQVAKLNWLLVTSDSWQ